MKSDVKDYYSLSLKERVVRAFIKEHRRSPSSEQVAVLVAEAEGEMPLLNKVGFSQYDIAVPHFGEVSSAKAFNSASKAAQDDLFVLDKKMNNLASLLEDGYRSFKSTLDRCKKMSMAVESRLDNLLILSKRTDVFVHGVEESFDTAEAIDLEASTVEVHPGYVSLGRHKYESKNLDSAIISTTCFAPNGKVGSSNISSPRNLFSQDGTDWTYAAVSTSPVGRMVCIIELDFDEIEGTYVGDVKLVGNTIDANSKTAVNIYYSLNGSDYILSEPANTLLKPGENAFCLGKEHVKRIKITLEKKAADYKDENNRHIYLFSLDSLEIMQNEYSLNKESVLYAGPYHVTDDSGKPINFSMASISHGTCCLIPEKTSIDFYLSKDGVDWKPAPLFGGAGDTVRFSSDIPGEVSLLSPENNSRFSLLDDIPLLKSMDVGISHGTEAVCNVYIPSELSTEFVLENTFVKRNLRQKGIRAYGLPTGWFNDKENLRYSTTLKIESLEGVTLDLGSSSAYLNGRSVTGEVTIPKGYHSFSTSYVNWVDVPEGIKSLDVLKAYDPLYPRNHKLLVEGYDYPKEFKGEKWYNGLSSETFGCLLQYVSPERFLSSKHDTDLRIYTIEEYNGNLFFKVKIDSKDASWVKEMVEIVYVLRSSKTNTLYVKAVLKSKDEKISPNINKFQARVI